jgi:hypothetical protein
MQSNSRAKLERLARVIPYVLLLAFPAFLLIFPEMYVRNTCIFNPFYFKFCYCFFFFYNLMKWTVLSLLATIPWVTY